MATVNTNNSNEKNEAKDIVDRLRAAPDRETRKEVADKIVEEIKKIK